MRVTFLILFILFLPFATRAEVHEELKGKFGAVLMITDGKNGTPLQSVKPNMKLVGIIKLVGCQPNANGYCDVEAEIRTKGPNGSVVQTMRNKLENQKAPAPGEVITGWVFGYGFDNKDSLGKHTIEATIRDFVSGQAIKLSNDLTLIK